MLSKQNVIFDDDQVEVDILRQKGHLDHLITLHALRGQVRDDHSPETDLPVIDELRIYTDILGAFVAFFLFKFARLANMLYSCAVLSKRDDTRTLCTPIGDSISCDGHLHGHV